MTVKHFFQISDFTQEEIISILNDALEFSNRQKMWMFPERKLVANLFFEPSTRTHFSFASAQHQLGCKVENFQPQSSSIVKGESLYDTVRTFQAIGYDALIIRHPQDFYFKELQNISIPIINAGDGKGNHPTQCLLDLMTILKEFQTLSGLKIVIIGDIAHSRVAHSFAQAMRIFNSQVVFSGPNEYMDFNQEYIDIDDAIPWADVVMMLRVQHERHQEEMKMSKEQYLKAYGLTKQRYEKLQSHAIVMHPAPMNRGVEIEDCVVEASKSRIFQQMENGVYVRKAVLKYVFGYQFEEQ